MTNHSTPLWLGMLSLVACETAPNASSSTSLSTATSPTATTEAPGKIPGQASLRGKVTLVGPTPKLPPIDAGVDPFCAKNQIPNESLRVDPKGGIADVVITLRGRGASPVSSAPVSVDQRGCQYTPRVQCGAVGQRLVVTSSDMTLHNVHSYQGDNRGNWFNKIQPPHAAAIDELLRVPGRVQLTCDVHPWMSAWINVVDDGRCTVTNAQGDFDFGAVPPGNYEVVAWQERLGEKRLKTTITPGLDGVVDFGMTSPSE